ncbi:DNA polymerase III subunit beta [Oceanobacillus sp. J11TS1]|uniref:DNA polymerase III subunit beta n=1 Tax=Oceanobacillus sp. J11TS1 TaxID=2807191 RepID=UPI001B055393|nr:DNA polymerase III subunit beta [Oceanobacillus sp. J11TS1]GIO23995.1 DNA polymerase III subunit beta [Oceanobacillus sp. J11TS1]
MRFTIQRDKLIASVQDVMKAISARTVIPILTGMKIEVKKHGVTLTGSDSDISIESYIPTEDEDKVYIENIEEGNIVLQAKYFPEIVRKLPESQVDIVVDDQFNVKITSGKSEFNLNGQSADEYPLLPKLQTENSFEMPIDLLKSMIKQTGFAVSTMETRPILTGVNIQLKDQKLVFTATDSHRLAKREVPIANTAISIEQVVVPGKSLSELYKILNDSEDTVEISVTNNQILFRTKHLNFLSRLLDGNYPETSRLIPDHSKTTIQIKTTPLLRSIERASLLAKEERNNVVKFTSTDNAVIEISSNSPEIGNVVEEVSADQIDGEDLKISFSSKYMIDALKAIEYDEVVIEFTGAMRPFIIRPVENDSILQLILPVRTY